MLIKTNVSRGSVSVWQVAAAVSHLNPAASLLEHLPRLPAPCTCTLHALLPLHCSCTALHCYRPPAHVLHPDVPTVVCCSACPPVAPWSGGGPPPGHHPPPRLRTQELAHTGRCHTGAGVVRVWCEAACNSTPSRSTEAPRHGGWAGATTHLHTHQHTGGRPQLGRTADSGNDVSLVL